MVAAGLVLVAALFFFFAGVVARVGCCPSPGGGICDDCCPRGFLLGEKPAPNNRSALLPQHNDTIQSA